MKDWNYGDSWEKYPIEAGQIWQAGTGRVAVHNIFDPLPSFMLEADAIFSDPPWNLGNVNSFYTKAKVEEKLKSFESFKDRLFECIKQIDPRFCYLEVGKQAVADFKLRLNLQFPLMTEFGSKYYKKHLCYILFGGSRLVDILPVGGIDEMDAIAQITKDADYKCIADLCMGRGQVGLTAFRAGRPFVGTELNKRRLAVLLDHIAQEGGECKRID